MKKIIFYLLVIILISMVGCSDEADEVEVYYKGNVLVESEVDIYADEDVETDYNEDSDGISGGLKFGEKFEFAGFEITLFEDLRFVYYETVVSEWDEAGKYFYIPVLIRHLNSDLIFETENNWEIEDYLKRFTFVNEIGFTNYNFWGGVWREPGRDAFQTHMGIPILGWRNEHFSDAGVWTYIRGKYSGEGKYVVQFYVDAEFYSDDDDKMQISKSSVLELNLDINWPDEYTTIIFESELVDPRTDFVVGDLQIAVESDFRIISEFYGGTNHYFYITFFNVGDNLIHLSDFEPTTFAQNGSNPVRRVYRESERINIYNLQEFEPGKIHRLEIPYMSSTCGQTLPIRTIRLSESKEDADNNKITIKHHMIEICVDSESILCEFPW